jgi:hypothetical protein
VHHAFVPLIHTEFTTYPMYFPSLDGNLIAVLVTKCLSWYHKVWVILLNNGSMVQDCGAKQGSGHVT